MERSQFRDRCLTVTPIDHDRTKSASTLNPDHFKDLKRVLQRAEAADSKAQACEFLTNLKLAIPGFLWRKNGLELCVVDKTK